MKQPNWFARLISTLIHLEFSPEKIDVSLFIQITDSIIIVYVDDIITFGNSSKAMEGLTQKLYALFLFLFSFL